MVARDAKLGGKVAGRESAIGGVRVLPEGAILRISQVLGPQARGCRLVPAALETAVVLVVAGLSCGADLLIVNKFGKHEAEGGPRRDRRDGRDG
jgi:hypothetical protein